MIGVCHDLPIITSNDLIVDVDDSIVPDPIVFMGSA